jgi:hypothetical protein
MDVGRFLADGIAPEGSAVTPSANREELFLSKPLRIDNQVEAVPEAQDLDATAWRSLNRLSAAGRPEAMAFASLRRGRMGRSMDGSRLFFLHDSNKTGTVSFAEKAHHLSAEQTGRSKNALCERSEQKAREATGLRRAAGDD